MKFILLSDTHLLYQNPVGRLDNLVDVQFDKLNFIFDKAQEFGCPVLIAGDLFNKPRSWTLLPIVMSFLKERDVQVFCVYGQHDTYLYSDETRDRTNLGILEKAGLVEILNNDPVFFRDIFLYGCSFGSEIPIPTIGGINILVIHAPISNAAIYPGQEFTLAKNFLLTHDKYDLILCGDIHRKFVEQIGNRIIVNSGPMLRKEASEYNFKHSPGFFIYDADDRKVEWIEIPHRSANEVLSREHIEKQIETESMLDDFIEMMKDDSEESHGVSFQENLQEFIRKNSVEKGIVDYLSELMGGRNE